MTRFGSSGQRGIVGDHHETSTEEICGNSEPHTESGCGDRGRPEQRGPGAA
jgi:hypothetical protein